jgi:hypothetical protein
MNGWTFSNNKDYWENVCDVYPTKIDAIRAGKEYYIDNDADIKHIFIGFVIHRELSENAIDVDSILEDVNNQVNDEIGECELEDYLLDLPDEQVKELSNALNLVFHGWIKKHNLEPNYYDIKNIECIKLESNGVK